MPRKLPKILSDDELALLLEQPNTRTITGLRNRAMLELLAFGGLRIGEIVNLTPGRVRWQTGEVEVVNGKGGSDRIIPLHKNSMDWLHRWSQARPTHSKSFFTTISGAKPGAKLQPRYVAQMVHRYAVDGGIQDFTTRESGRRAWKVHPHTLRHTYASRLLDQGFSLAEVQQLLGHSNIITTSVYLHTNPKDLREKIQAQPTREENALDAEELEAAGRKLLALAAQARGVPNQPDKESTEGP